MKELNILNLLMTSQDNSNRNIKQQLNETKSKWEITMDVMMIIGKYFKKNNDYAMWLKVIKFHDYYHLPKCLARYRRGRKGSISTHNYTKLLNWHYRLFRQTDHKIA